MIPIENQICNLEMAKRLKELGVRQESVFYWIYDVAENYSRIFHKNESFNCRMLFGIGLEEGIEIYSAYTFSELWPKLPVGAKMINCSREVTESAISIRDSEERFKNIPTLFCEDENIANMAAEFLIYLLENSGVKEW